MASQISSGFIRRKWRYFAGVFMTLVLGALIGTGYAWYQLFHDMPQMPDKEALWSLERSQAYEFLDIKGARITVRGPRYGRVVQAGDLPDHIPAAFIAAEDKRFYSHNGADMAALARALWSNLTSGRTVSGASTITQQVVKNLLLSPEQTLKRKAQEMRLARQMETRLGKEEILTLYLNRIYFGSNAYGISAAAEKYFGKSATELTLAEASLLATLPKAPSRLALDNNMAGARQRQVYVLNQMVNSGAIEADERDRAIGEDVQLIKEVYDGADFGYALDRATEKLSQIVPNAPSDVIITLTLDKALQSQSAELLRRKIKGQGYPVKATQGAALFMRPSGAISVMIGGIDYNESQFNRTLQAQRQPGSSFKLFVFAAALTRGITPHDIYTDEPVDFEGWSPANYNGQYQGRMTVFEAFAKSVNTIAAQLGHEIGETGIVTLARALGISSPIEAVPSIALGSVEVNMMELTSAYGIFANQGRRIDPYLIERVEDTRGRILYARPNFEPAQIFPTQHIANMNAMLAEVVRSGTGKNAAVKDWTVAGKTGTSQDWRDAWFIGFSSEMIGGVWVGNDNDTAMQRVTGGGLPADIWSDIMTLALADKMPSFLPGTEQALAVPKLIFAQTEPSEIDRRKAFYSELADAFARVR